MSFSNKKALLFAGALILTAGGVFGVRSYVMTPAIAETEVAQAVPQAKPVQVELVETSPVQVWNKLSARLTAVDFAEIKPQVGGMVTDVRINDGQQVEQGQILFVIDPRPFEADVKQAKAELQAARSSASFARKELVRAKNLVKRKAVSENVYDERVNAVALADADILAANAKLQQAEIALDHAYVKAPISGRISRAEITLGNIVAAGGNAPVLTSIVSDHGIYADFDVDENTYLNFIRPAAKDNSSEKQIPVKLTLGAQNKEFDGFVHSFDNRINVASGTIRARAFFANKEGDLLPGMFGTLQLASAVAQQEILISETAIGTNQDRKFVYIIDDKGTAAYRQVMLGSKIGDKRVITSGLNNGEQVIREGLMRIRPGMPVVAASDQADQS